MTRATGQAAAVPTARAIASPADWRGREIAARSDWTHELSAPEISELDAAFRAARASGLGFAGLTAENFAVPHFAAIAARALDVLENGPGLFLIRGFPAARYAPADLRLIYWGMGLHLGTAVTQSADGDVLGDVRDLKVDVKSPRGRGYRTNQKLSFHCDSADVTGLFVVQTAKSGGLSLIASSVAVRNEIARTRPDLLAVLHAPFHWSMQEQHKPGEPPTYLQPVFSECDGRFSCRIIRAQIENAQRYEGVPALTPAQTEALDLVAALAADQRFCFSMMFEPGDLQLLNNHVCLHARTAFDDHDAPERKRHLLRMWIAPPNSRPLSPLMGHIYKDRRPGAVRGGFPGLTPTRIYETPLLYGDRPFGAPGETP
jgi:hypothetical protein